MGRPRAFNSVDVLDKAMAVFWEKGYAATSLSDVQAATGLSKSSLYGSFGSKHDLFLQALARYRETVTERAAAALESDAPARAAIRTAFMQVVDAAGRAEAPRGCFSCNCAVELAAHDRAAARGVDAVCRRLEDGFAAAVRRGQAAGEVPADHDPHALARYFNTALNGLTVMAKARTDRQALESVVEITLKALD